jgi:hypothetical protein
MDLDRISHIIVYDSPSQLLEPLRSPPQRRCPHPRPRPPLRLT